MSIKWNMVGLFAVLLSTFVKRLPETDHFKLWLFLTSFPSLCVLSFKPGLYIYYFIITPGSFTCVLNVIAFTYAAFPCHQIPYYANIRSVFPQPFTVIRACGAVNSQLILVNSGTGLTYRWTKECDTQTKRRCLHYLGPIRYSRSLIYTDKIMLAMMASQVCLIKLLLVWYLQLWH